MLRDVSTDLRRLFTEAERKKGNPLSKRIVDNIDEWLRDELKVMIDEQIYEENPIAEIQFMTSSSKPAKSD